MNRYIAVIGALLLAVVAVASACTAATADWIHFTLEPERGGQAIQATFRSGERSRNESNWSTDFRPAELTGLDLAGFRSAGTRPLHFALVREAGRLDCSGHGGKSYAAGDCSFSANPAFALLLASHGIARPTDQQSLSLMAVNVSRELIDSLAGARYPTPSIDNLVALSAVGVTGPYISGMAHAGYRPRTLDELIQFKALDISPQWIAGFARIGYASLPADELVQLKALDITPEFIAGFDRVGYGHLPVDQLVQLKALDITPEFVQRVAAVDQKLPPVDKLVALKAFGEKH